MKYLALAALLPLAACVAEPVTPPPANEPPANTDACGASNYQFLVGQPRAVLASMTFPAPTRDFGPDDAITMDFNPERLNIQYNANGIITRVFCG